MPGSLRAVWRGLLCCGMAGFALGAAAADKLVFCAEDRDLRPWITRDGRGLNFELLNRLAFGAYPGGERADPRKRLNMDRYLLVRPKGAGVAWDGKRLSGLKGPVGAPLGYSIADHLRGIGVAVDEGSPGATELLRKLLAGHVEAVVMLDGEACSLLAEDPRYAVLLEIVAQPLVEKPYYLPLSRRFVAARPELAEAIWRVIEQVRESRDYQAREKR